MTPQPQAIKYLSRWRRLAARLAEAVVWSPMAFVHYLSSPWAEIGLGVLLVAQTAYRYYLYRNHSAVLGHLAVGARVIDHQTGERLSPRQSRNRALLQVLDSLVITFFINAAMVIFRQDRRHLYDLLAGTVVVRDEPVAEEPTTARRPMPAPSDD